MKLAIIQARMASRRLPGKALADIAGRSLLAHTLARARRIAGIDGVWLATSRRSENDVLEDLASGLGCDVHRGDEDNVLGRFCDIVERAPATTVIRLTGDNPFIDWRAMSWLLALHERMGNDYSCFAGMPSGSVGDIFSRYALLTSNRDADGAALADHVDMHVLEHQDRFRLSCRTVIPSLSAYRMTVDDETDLARVRRLADRVASSGRELDSLTTDALLVAVAAAGLESDFTPITKSVSPENLRTAELIKQIADHGDIRMADLQNEPPPRR